MVSGGVLNAMKLSSLNSNFSQLIRPKLFILSRWFPVSMHAVTKVTLALGILTLSDLACQRKLSVMKFCSYNLSHF